MLAVAVQFLVLWSLIWLATSSFLKRCLLWLWWIFSFFGLFARSSWPDPKCPCSFIPLQVLPGIFCFMGLMITCRLMTSTSLVPTWYFPLEVSLKPYHSCCGWIWWKWSGVSVPFFLFWVMLPHPSCQLNMSHSSGLLNTSLTDTVAPHLQSLCFQPYLFACINFLALSLHWFLNSLFSCSIFFLLTCRNSSYIWPHVWILKVFIIKHVSLCTASKSPVS